MVFKFFLNETSCVMLQKQAFEDGGFRGRANKATDTCYAFWCVLMILVWVFLLIFVISCICNRSSIKFFRVGGTLRILQADKFINEEALRGFLLTCQYKVLFNSPFVSNNWTIMLSRTLKFWNALPLFPLFPITRIFICQNHETPNNSCMQQEYIDLSCYFSTI